MFAGEGQKSPNKIMATMNVQEYPKKKIISLENQIETSWGNILADYITRNVLLSAQMGERASVVLICIITSCFEL